MKNLLHIAVLLGILAGFGTTKADNAFSVGQYNGSPTIFVNGQPEFGLFHFSEEITPDYAEKFTQAGFKFHSCIELGHYLNLGWKGDGEFDFSHIDKLLKDFHDRVPNGYILPKVHVWAPQWWVEKYPEEIMGYETLPSDYVYRDGVASKHESLASLKWRKEAGEGLRKLVEHIQQSPYADQVIGIFVAGGQAGEWHPWYWLTDNTIDHSKPMLAAFKTYLQTKYSNDVKKLRKAWNDDQVTFDTVKIPSGKQRQKADYGIFIDPANSRKVVDFREAFHDIVAEDIEYFCSIVKEQSKGKFLTCVQYAYTADIPWASQETHHRAGEKILDSENIDIITSPHSYYHRGMGEAGVLRHYLGSLRNHNKYFIDETDERTHLSFPKTCFCHAKTLDESISLMWRSFANVVANGAGMWYMDHTSGKWFDDPAFFETFKKVSKCADYSMKLSRASVADVAIFSSTQSEFYTSTKADLTAQFMVAQRNQITKAGMPVDWYLIDDIGQDFVKDYKVYVFLDCFYLTDSQRNAIEKLKANDKTFVWFYAPGLINEKQISVNDMKKLTGFDFEVSSKPFDYVKLEKKLIGSNGLEYRLWRDAYFGECGKLNPRFVVKNDNCKIIGRYADDNSPALAVKQQNGWKSIYVPTGNLPWYACNELFKEASVHSYIDSGDIVYTNRSWLGIHASSDGLKRVELQDAENVYDVINNKLIGKGIRSFYVNMKKGETALYVFSEGIN